MAEMTMIRAAMAARAKMAETGAAGGGGPSAGLAALAAAGKPPIYKGAAGGAPRGPGIGYFMNTRRVPTPSAPPAGGEGPAAANEPPPAVPQATIDTFSVVLGVSEAQTRKVISNLMASKQIEGYFTAFTASLPLLTLDEARGTLTIGATPVAVRSLKKGSYGSIWREDGADHIYKVIKTGAGADKDNNTREVYLEVLVTVLLQTDTRYGQHVGHIEKLYRTGDGLAFKMEAIQYDGMAYIGKDGPANLAVAGPHFAKIGEVMNYFNKKYGFYHRDFHAGNFMFTADGTLKIIDFGKSCFTIGGSTYSLANVVCQSLDPLIFLSCVLEYYDHNINDAVANRINDYFTIGGRNFLDDVKLWHTLGGQGRQSAIFHYFYHSVAVGENFPGSLRRTPRQRGAPWSLNAELEGSPAAGETTFWEEFMGATMLRRTTFEFFARAWGPGGIPAAGGARRQRTRRAQ